MAFSMAFNREVVKNLPDYYRKDPESNNYKLLEIGGRTRDQARQDLEAVAGMLDIENVFGKTLDYLGARFGQLRGIANDTQYRVLILSRIARIFSTGSYPSILDAICKTFSCAPDQVRLERTELPANLKITRFPLVLVDLAGLTLAQAVSIIREMMPAGVGLESLRFDGTFEFAEDVGFFDELAGFSDDAGTIGGYFGIEYGSDDDVFPID